MIQVPKNNKKFRSPCVSDNLVTRDGFSRPVPRQPAHLHTQAEYGAYLRDSSRVPRRRPYRSTITGRTLPIIVTLIKFNFTLFLDHIIIVRNSYSKYFVHL